jgi:hypothetical protein
VGQQREAVEQHERGDRPGQLVDPVVDAALAEDQAGQPLRGGEEEQRRHHEREHEVLAHVHQVQVPLADVVHRPVGGDPQQHDAGDEGGPLERRDDGSAGGHGLRADDPDGVRVEHDQAADQHPHLGVRHPPPEVRAPGGLGQHYDARMNLK